MNFIFIIAHIHTVVPLQGGVFPAEPVQSGLEGIKPVLEKLMLSNIHLVLICNFRQGDRALVNNVLSTTGCKRTLQRVSGCFVTGSV